MGSTTLRQDIERMYKYTDWHRLLSAALGLAYILPAFYYHGAGCGLRTSSGVIFLVACIWFPDELGEYGRGFWPRQISRPTPGVFVRWAAWLLLTFPLWMRLVLLVGGVKSAVRSG